MPPSVETHLANTVLTNGARYYVDHAHPGVLDAGVRQPARGSSSTTRPAKRSSAGRWPRPGGSSPTRSPVVVYKNNSDGKGNSYGCHENYLMDRALPFAEIVTGVVPHFVTRQIFAGAGKVGSRDGVLRPGRLPDHAAGGVLRGGRRSRDDAEAADRQHPRRAARRPAPVPPPARHRRRRQPVGGLDVPQGRDDRARPGDARGRRDAPPRPLAGRSGPGDAPRLDRPHAGRAR